MKKYDIIVIGMGPAGMAVTAMGAAMGLKILSVEPHKIGGECLNVGCIPSKALLKAADGKYVAENLQKYGLQATVDFEEGNPLETVREKIDAINSKKMMKAFEKADLLLGKGKASFVDAHTIQVKGEYYSAKKIFIATGTAPFIPPIPGLKEVPRLTNMNIFHQEQVPKSLTVIGGGAIGTEMAQAFSRLGSQVNIVQMDAHLIPVGDEEAGRELERQLVKEGIGVYNSTSISKVEEKNGVIFTHTNKGVFESEKILVATGRKPVVESLHLEKAGIGYTKRGITVDDHLRTSQKHIYAVGDINGKAQLSHAAMHQGMLALMDAISPVRLNKLKSKNWLVPWSVFTSPEVAQVGLTEKEATEKGLKYEVTKKDYSAYGRMVADGHPEGFIKVLTSRSGKIYGATIVGASASELIQEWTMAIQYGKRITDVMMMQHAFPAVSMLNKMVAEDWMMNKMKSKTLQNIIKKIF